MIQEVQRVYRLQGVEINDKHIEVIVRQMLKKIRIEERGDTEFLPGTMVDVLEFNEVNEQMEAEGKEAATGEQIMLGITKHLWLQNPSCLQHPSRRQQKS